jgi:hypothetical protein
MNENNPIKMSKRLKEIFIDYLVFLMHLGLLFIAGLTAFFRVFKGMPEFTHIQAQFVAAFASVVPIAVIFSVLDSSKSLGALRKAGLINFFALLFLVFRGKAR